MEIGCLKNEEERQPLKFLWPKETIDMAINIAREARQILGAMGIIGDYSIMRHMMNLESVITYEEHMIFIY
jgi:glutaryl-CoA dehydrogenase